MLKFLDFAKIQFLKAIHNLTNQQNVSSTVFRFCKNTIFESNSQLQLINSWKSSEFLDFAKIQFLKAIHNVRQLVEPLQHVFRFCKNTIFESNSQLGCISELMQFCF